MKYLQLFERFYRPDPKIVEKLDNLVKELSEKHHGGREFFDALDFNIKHIIDSKLIIDLVKGNPNEYVASSGEFGDILYNLWKKEKFNCKGIVVFSGKLNAEKKDVGYHYPENFNLNNKSFIYVDDSYFSGNTVRKIENYLSRYNSEIKSVSVVYDGSKEKNEKVKSFFRYYK